VAHVGHARVATVSGSELNWHEMQVAKVGPAGVTPATLIRGATEPNGAADAPIEDRARKTRISTAAFDTLISPEKGGGPTV
jgi:hypothetical protein